MATVNAPYPDHMTILDGQSLESANPDPSDNSVIQFKNRAGAVVSEVVVRDPNTKLTPALIRQGAFDFKAREVIVKDWSHPNKPNKQLPDADVLPASSVQDLRWSPCGRYLAVLTVNTPFIIWYKRSGDALTKLADPAALPAAANALSWSPNGQYLMVSGGTSGVINTLYKRAGDVLTRRAYDDSMFVDFPSGEPTAVDLDWTRDNSLLIWAGATPAAFRRNSITSEAFNYKAFTFPANVNGVAFSPTSRKFVLTSSTVYPYIFLYDYASDGTITARAAPVDKPEGSVYGNHAAAWSPDGKYVAFCLSSGKHGYVYRITDSGYWSLVAMTPDVFSSNMFSTAWHPSGKYVFFSGAPGTGSASVFGYSFDGTTLTPLAGSLSGTNLGVASIKAIQFTPDGKYLAEGLTSAPYLLWHKSAEGALEGLLTKIDDAAYEVKQS